MIYTPLMPHQRKALKFLMDRRESMLPMPLGTGKSLVALAWAQQVKARNILITSDKNNAVNNWPDQVYQHTDWGCYLRPDKGQLDVMYRCHQNDTPFVVIVNYDILYHRLDEYLNIPWDLWIGDESGEFKDQRTRRHKSLARIVKSIPRCVLLNGKMVTERIEDLYGQYRLLDGGISLGRTMSQFRNRYMQPSPDGYGFCAQRSAFTRICEDTKHNTYWMPHDPSLKMPTKAYHTVKVDLPDHLREIDTMLREDFGAELDSGAKIEVNHAVSVFIKRHQLCGGVFSPADIYGESNAKPELIGSPKLDVVRGVVNQNPGAKIVVWHQYVAETILLRNTLEEMRVRPYVYESASSSSKQVLDVFAGADEGVLLIRNSMCKGINQLSNVNISVFYSNSLSYQRRSQAEGRARRLVSSNPETHYIDIVVRNTVDEMVYHMMGQKKNVDLTFGTLVGIMRKI